MAADDSYDIGQQLIWNKSLISLFCCACPAEGVEEAHIVVGSGSVEFFKGQSLELLCEITAGNHVSYKWLQNGQLISPSPSLHLSDNRLFISRLVENPFVPSMESCSCVPEWWLWHCPCCCEQSEKCVWLFDRSSNLCLGGTTWLVGGCSVVAVVILSSLWISVYEDGRQDCSPKVKPKPLDLPLVAGWYTV